MSKKIQLVLITLSLRPDGWNMRTVPVEASETEKNFCPPGKRMKKESLHAVLTNMNEYPGMYFYHAYTTPDKVKEVQLKLVNHIAERVKADAAKMKAIESHVDQIPSLSHV